MKQCSNCDREVTDDFFRVFKVPVGSNPFGEDVYKLLGCPHCGNAYGQDYTTQERPEEAELGGTEPEELSI